MPKEEWGTKRLCPHCGTRFYDLNRDPMTCPACNNSFDVESLAPSGRSRALTSEKTAAKEEEEQDVLDDDDDLESDGGEIDDDLLDDDDDDSEVSLEEIADVSNEDDDS